MWVKNKLSEHYAFVIVAVLICFKVGISGASVATIGNFITPVVSELNIKVSQFTTIVSIQAIVMALLYTTASKVLATKRISRVMGISALFEVFGILLMSVSKSIYVFYVAGAILGAAQAFTGFVAIPLVINMWFEEKSGTALGLVVGVGFAASIGYSLFSAELITVLGWRWAYLILALVGGLISVPVAFKFLKSPEEMGVHPYGYQETVLDSETSHSQSIQSTKYGITLKQAFGQLFFWLAWITCLSYSYASGVNGYLANFTTMELGQTINFGAVSAIFLSVGGIGSSIAIGHLNDKFGITAGLIWGAVFTVLGYALISVSYRNVSYIFPAAFTLGLTSSMYTVQCPLLVREIVGTKHYSKIWSLMMMFNSLIGGGLYSTIGLFYDNFGTYRGAFILSIVLHIGAMFLGSIAVVLAKRYQNNQGTVNIVS